MKRYKWEHNPQPHKQLTNKQMSYSEKYQQLENQIEELQNAKNETEQQLQTTRLQKAALTKQIGDLEEGLQEKT